VTDPITVEILLKMKTGESTPQEFEVTTPEVVIDTQTELHQLTPAQREAHERLQLQRDFKGRKLRLQHAYGLPIRKERK
jgi:hypothetical protein